ncbi:MAG: FAD-dependent oxidoreductase, partial [Microbacteriaceae bacterium]
MTTRSETDALSRLPQHVVDVAVVGAGVTGLTTALLLARRGLDVCVVSDDAALSDDAAPSDDVAPGGRPDAPAAISRLQGSRLARVRGRTTASTTRAFAESQDAAVRWLEDFVPSRDVPHRRRPAITYAIGERALAELDAEERLGRLLGRPVEETTDVGLPFQPRRALRLPDQLHVDPGDLLAALRRAARDAGVTLVAPVRVRGARASNPVVVDTDAGDLRADRLILATGTPILDRGLYFAKLAPRRTLFLSSRVADSELPEATAWGIDAPVQQLGAGLGGSDGLLVTAGGEHGVGRSASDRHAMDALVAGTRRWWPGAEIEREWSAQGYEAPHLVPFVGWLPRSRGRIFLAAGFGGAGLAGGSLTGGVAAALTLEADLLGDSTDWQKTLHRRLTLPPAVAAGIGENAAA